MDSPASKEELHGGDHYPGLSVRPMFFLLLELKFSARPSTTQEARLATPPNWLRDLRTARGSSGIASA